MVARGGGETEAVGPSPGIQRGGKAGAYKMVVVGVAKKTGRHWLWPAR